MSTEFNGKIEVVWRARPEPLTPCGVAVREESARVLAQRLLTRRPEELARLQGVHAPGLLVLLGEADDLPWVDGSVYLGREIGAAHLLIPTTLTCSTPLPLLERALCRQASEFQWPLALLPAWNQIVMLGAARVVARETLTGWLEGNR